MSKDIIDIAKKRYHDKVASSTRCLTVDELTKNPDEPFKVHVRPITTEQFQKIRAGEDEIDRCVITLIERALDADGKKLFSYAEKNEMKRFLEPQMLIKLVRRINEDVNSLFDDDGVEVVGN